MSTNKVHHFEVESIQFGTWKISMGDHLLMPSTAQLPHPELKVKILTGHEKLVYEFPFYNPSFPNHNMAKIETAPVFVKGLSQPGDGLSIMLQLWRPPNTHFGVQPIESKVSRSKFETDLVDFSGGPVRSYVVHTIKFKTAADASQFRAVLAQQSVALHKRQIRDAYDCGLLYEYDGTIGANSPVQADESDKFRPGAGAYISTRCRQEKQTRLHEMSRAAKEGAAGSTAAVAARMQQQQQQQQEEQESSSSDDEDQAAYEGAAYEGAVPKRACWALPEAAPTGDTGAQADQGS